jgi:uncharacterized protein YtpQ (UPF0354 family)
MSLFKKLFGKSPKASEATPAGESIFDTHREKIYPWVKVTFKNDVPEDTKSEFQLVGENAIVMREWLGDLIIIYVADMGNNFQVLFERDLPANVTEEEVHQLAIDNLSRDIEFKLHETNFGGHGLIAGGDHEAGSICLPGIWEWLADHFNDNLIVGIPAKDLVFIVTETDTDKISNLKISIHEFFKKGERLLTRNIFRFDKETKEWTIIDRVG